MRKFLTLTTLVLFLAVCALAQAGKPKTAKPATSTPAIPASSAAASGSPLTVEQVDAYFKRMFGFETNLRFQVAKVEPAQMPGMWDAIVVVNTPEGQQLTHWYVSSDLHWVVTGEVFPYGKDPFAKPREALKQRSFGPVKGDTTSKVLLVEFADLECPGCRVAQTTMEKLQQDFPNVKFVFQSFPIETLHPWAMTAAKYLDCLQRGNNEQAWTFLGAVYTHQQEIEQGVRTPAGSIDEKAVLERMNKYVAMSGGNVEKVAACATQPESALRIRNSIALGNEVGITGTPTLFINGRVINSPGQQPYETLKTIIQYEIEQAAK